MLAKVMMYLHVFITDAYSYIQGKHALPITAIAK